MDWTRRHGRKVAGLPQEPSEGGVCEVAQAGAMGCLLLQPTRVVLTQAPAPHPTPLSCFLDTAKHVGKHTMTFP